MITYIFLGLVAISTAIAFSNWRYALFLVLVVGMLQDPVRKLAPGAPSLFVLSTLPIWAALFVNMLTTDRRLMALFPGTYPTLVLRMRMFLLMIIPGAFVMLMRGINLWPVVLLGAFGYFAPVLGILIGFVLSLNTKFLLRFLTFYCFLVALMMSGTLMEYMNIYPGWKAIGTSAMKMVWIKYVSYGHTIHLKAGFFRSPDIMGWHGAIMTMIALTLFFAKSSRFSRWIWLIFAVWGVLCIVISGRYKMIAMPMVWAVSFAALTAFYQGIGRMIGLVLVGILVIAGMSMVSSKVGLGGSDYTLYASSPLSYSLNRADRHGVKAVIGTYSQSGFWGNGLGSATQGARYAGVKFKKGWQEGGLSKIMAELGAGGLIFFLLLCLSLAGALISNIRGGLHKNRLSNLRAGLLCIILANAVSFVISSQIFSDLFVLSIISICMGFVLSGKSQDIAEV